MLEKEIKQKIDRDLKEYSEQVNIPGMAVVASRNGEIIYEHYYGYRDVTNKLPVTGETIFGLASITKSFASLAIMQLHEEGRLELTDPVNKWIPNFALPGNQPSDGVCIHHLMTHTSGLPGLPLVHQARLASILRDPDGKKIFGNEDIYGKKQITTVDELVDEIKDIDREALGRPGEMFNYSNESYALLQKIIEEASGMTFLDYMDLRVLGPLKMKRSSFLTEEIKGRENVTELYAYDVEGDQDYFHSPTWWEVGDIYTNGSLKASPYDLINYAKMFYQGGVFQGKEILSASSIAEMTRVQARTPNEVNYGYGLTIGEAYGRKLFGHGGGIKGVSSYFLVLPEEGLAIVVLINIAEAAAEHMALITLRGILEKDEEKPDHPLLAITSEGLSKYTGAYASLEGQRVQVDKGEKEQLLLTNGRQRIPISYIGDHKFITKDGKIITFIEKNQQIVGIFRGLRFIEKSN